MAKLPRYTRGTLLASGATAYYWELPTWARPKQGPDGKPVPVERHGRACPVESEPLGTDLAKAVEKADARNALFDSWKKGERTEMTVGTVKWLFAWYRNQHRFKKNAAKTKKDYHDIMDRVEALPMKVGVFGDRLASKVDALAADTLYDIFKPLGKRMAAYIMQVCRLVWTWAVRHKATTGVTENPFAKMSIETGAVAGNRETSRAEYDLYRETARAMGFQSMATAAALSFEFCQRVWDVFGFVDPEGRKRRGFPWADYAPGESFAFTQSKTGKKMNLPLSERVGGQVVLLYPELEEELARMKAGDVVGVTIVVEERNGQPYTPRRMSTVHRLICNKAGLPKNMTFTGFRHGGSTELGDAGIEDIRPITGHDEAKTAQIYNKINERKARTIAARRREHLALLAELEGAADEQEEPISTSQAN